MSYIDSVFHIGMPYISMCYICRNVILVVCFIFVYIRCGIQYISILVVCFILVVYLILVRYSTFVVFTLVYIQYGIQYISIPDIGSVFHIRSVLHIGAYSMCYDISAPV